MTRIDALRAFDGSVFGFPAPPLLPQFERPWPSHGAPVRAIVRAGAPDLAPGDQAGLWKLRSGSLAPDLDTAIEHTLASMPEGGSLCLRPHFDSVLSDIPTTLSALRRFESRIELLLAPADLTAPAMLPHASDHLLRILTAFESHPAVKGVVLEDVTGSEPLGVQPAPAGTGLISLAAWQRAMSIVRQAGWPLVVDQHDRSSWLLGLS